MSTRESIAPRAGELLRSVPAAVKSVPRYAQYLDWPPLHVLAYLSGDLAAIAAAHMLAIRAIARFLHVSGGALSPAEYHRFYLPFFTVVLYLFEGYKSPELRRPEQELERSCKAVAVSFLGLILFNFVVFRSQVFSRYLLVGWFLLAVTFLVAARFTLRAIYGQLWNAGLCRRRAVLAGSPAGLSGYQQLLSIQRHRAYDLVGLLADFQPDGSLPERLLDLPVLGPLDDWELSLARASANLLIVAGPLGPDGEEWVACLLRRCRQLRIDVELYSEILATANMNYEHDEFSGSFRFYGKPQWSLAVQRVFKRGIDVAIGLIGSAVTLLLTPVVFALVNLEQHGPLFYRSAYLGQDGLVHYYLKFRTMRVDADQLLQADEDLRSRFRQRHKLLDDPRVTRVGRFLRKFSLDEFPQFFSILIGQLTFVGPRTIRQEEAAHYGPALNMLLSVKPGLTGFWQVMGRQTTTYRERVSMDMFYIDRWSIWLDLFIILKTFWTVAKTEGAH